MHDESSCMCALKLRQAGRGTQPGCSCVCRQCESLTALPRQAARALRRPLPNCVRREPPHLAASASSPSTSTDQAPGSTPRWALPRPTAAACIRTYIPDHRHPRRGSRSHCCPCCWASSRSRLPRSRRCTSTWNARGRLRRTTRQTWGFRQPRPADGRHVADRLDFLCTSCLNSFCSAR